MSACYCDADRPEFVERNEYTARKQHRCCECGRKIEPGTRYIRYSGKWDGEFMTYKRCESCDDLAESLEEVMCVWIGGLQECYADYLDSIGKTLDEDTYRRLFVD